MTPAERAAKLEAAQKLMQEVETDETATNPAAPVVNATQQKMTLAAQAAAAAKAAVVTQAPPAVVVPAVTVAAGGTTAVAGSGTPVPANIAAIDTARAKRDTPAAESTAAGKPSLWATLTGVAKAGFTGAKGVK